jgi:SAM-dependent methyltransferase
MNEQRHQEELYRNHKAWTNKPILGQIYRGFYAAIANIIVDNVDAPVVEIGSGIGKIIEVIPNCIRTDLLYSPWIDQVENAYQLSFDNQSVSNLILFDVFHHLKFPGTALDEFHRVLIPGGRVIILEPCVSLLGLLVYGCLHKEPLGLLKNISWQAPSKMEAIEQGYYAAQGNAFRIFCQNGFKKKLTAWKLFHRKKIAALPYIASGGYSGPQICNEKTFAQWDAVDRLLQPFPWIFACRLLIGIEKWSA